MMFVCFDEESYPFKRLASLRDGSLKVVSSFFGGDERFKVIVVVQLSNQQLQFFRRMMVSMSIYIHEKCFVW